MLNLVFMGSSDASSVTLRALLRAPRIRVAGVVTQPDRPSGRHQRLTPCACKAYAEECGLAPIITPENVNEPAVLEQLRELAPDVIVVVAFGQFLGRKLLALPCHGCINGHFSLLPKYRGAAPVQAAVASGDGVTGVTIMQMAAGMDDGAMLLKGIEPIYSDDTSVTLMERLAILGAYTMVKALNLLLQGQLKSVAQDHDKASFAYKLRKSDGMINWSLPAYLIERSTRAFEPWPGAFTFLPDKRGGLERIKIIRAQVLQQSASQYRDAPPGTICGLSPEGPLVTTGSGTICLTVVQPDGSRRMDGRSFLNGRTLVPGQHFVSPLEEQK